MNPNNQRDFYVEEEDEEKGIKDSEFPLWAKILLIVGSVIILLAIGILVFFLIKTKLNLRDREIELEDVKKLISKSYISNKEFKAAHESKAFLEAFARKVDNIQGLRSCPPCRTNICTGESSCARKPTSPVTSPSAGTVSSEGTTLTIPSQVIPIPRISRTPTVVPTVPVSSTGT